MVSFLVKPPSCGKDPYEPWEMTSRERDVSNKYLKLITYHVQRELIANKDQLNMIPRGQRSSQQPTPVGEKPSCANDLLSPEPQRPKSLVLDNLPGLVGSLVISPATSNSPGSRDSQKRPLLLPDLEEIRISPIISKRGYLNVLEHKTKVWKKRWVVVRRPYVFFFRDERDHCERGMINLAQAKTEYTLEQQNLVKNTFSITTKQNGFLIQTLNEKDVSDWLYAINPLLAGKIRSSTARSRPARGSTPRQSQGSSSTPTNPLPTTVPTVTMTGPTAVPPKKNWASLSSSLRVAVLNQVTFFKRQFHEEND